MRIDEKIDKYLKHDVNEGITIKEIYKWILAYANPMEWAKEIHKINKKNKTDKELQKEIDDFIKKTGKEWGAPAMLKVMNMIRKKEDEWYKN